MLLTQIKTIYADLDCFNFHTPADPHLLYSIRRAQESGKRGGENMDRGTRNRHMLVKQPGSEGGGRGRSRRLGASKIGVYGETDVGEPFLEVGNGADDVFDADLDRPIKCGGCACVTISVIVLAVVVSIIIGAVALGYGGASSQTRVYTQSELLRNTPYGQTLDGSGSPLGMTLPNNLESAGFVDVTYCATSRDAAAHTIGFEAGALTPTFDGGFSTATFSGVAGSTICYRAVAPDRVHVTSVFGVALS